MAKPEVFLDTNGVLDHLMDRQPFAEHAHRIFALAERGELRLHLSALSFCNLYYLLRNPLGPQKALALLVQLRHLTRVTGLGEREISAALAAPGRDFEDAVQYESAKSDEGIAVIITRNKKDFPESELPIMAPDEFLARWALEHGMS
jgi:predicted nucleic acid-binding protein